MTQNTMIFFGTKCVQEMMIKVMWTYVYVYSILDGNYTMFTNLYIAFIAIGNMVSPLKFEKSVSETLINYCRS